jgi:hypothetical protein
MRLIFPFRKIPIRLRPLSRLAGFCWGPAFSGSPLPFDVRQTGSCSRLNSIERRLAPVVAGLGLVGKDLIEVFSLFDEDVALQLGLMEQHSL